jgi:hypothetical protein
MYGELEGTVEEVGVAYFRLVVIVVENSWDA